MDWDVVGGWGQSVPRKRTLFRSRALARFRPRDFLIFLAKANRRGRESEASTERPQQSKHLVSFAFIFFFWGYGLWLLGLGLVVVRFCVLRARGFPFPIRNLRGFHHSRCDETMQEGRETLGWGLEMGAR